VKGASSSAKKRVRKRIPSALTAILPKARKAKAVVVGYGDISCN
jgi:hypothetical protein